MFFFLLSSLPPALPLLLRLLGTTQQTRPSRGNETRLLTLCRVSRDRRRLTNVLMVTLREEKGMSASGLLNRVRLISFFSSISSIIIMKTPPRVLLTPP